MESILVPTHNPSVRLNVRPDRQDDFDVLREIWCEDVYHVSERIKDAKLVVDVGANIGSFTCYALEMASKARVIAIEPEPHNLELLRMNVDRVSPKRCTIVTDAVSDYEGTATISDEAGGSRLGPDGIEVSVRLIDSVVSSMKLSGKQIDIFKIDIEGSEIPVLLSMSMELQENIKFFCVEYDRYSEGFGNVIEKLSETHKITTLGAASRGAMIFAERY